MSGGKVSSWIPRNQNLLVACIVGISIVDSVLVAFDSSLMGSLNVMPSYISYFTLTTTTKSLNTAVSYVGGAIAALIAGPIVDWRGRKECIYWSAPITIIGAVIQGCAQNIGMFLGGRFILGIGLGFSQVSAPTLVAETAPVQYRAFALGLYYAFWGVGNLLATGVCYGTQDLTSTWAWRIPSLVQAVPGILCMIVLLFVPESPRWLISKGRNEEALEILAIANAEGRTDDPVVLVQYKEITDTLRWEKERQLSLVQAITLKANRKRLIIAATFAMIVMLPGTNIVTFYFGDMLSSAGISSPKTQLEINIILTSWSLVIAVVGSIYADKVGRKTLCVAALVGGIISLYALAGLTATYGTSGNKSGVYGTIAMIFLYNASYSWGITPLTVLYPPEVLSFDIRAAGMGIYTCVTKLSGLFVAMVIPFGMDAIGWKVYIVNASVDILMVLGVIFYWVETRGKTLEEVDKMFDGRKHSDVPDLETVIQGKGMIDSTVLVGESISPVVSRIGENVIKGNKGKVGKL
ncbi:general substrate transporter [Pleomassaria siparia CBS 279.74]|uniref:General substrate transporter n=1 Tax=Pleomassaria siparia CBS 279.74 TaxID=1314801 RepID=A0A6G1JY12_9PLEO|nr:general substrate transporter [Pleomassaria siparia CBS 279.74]